MIDDIKRRSGFIVQHEDGRRGVAYHDDQYDQFSKQNKIVVRFFETDEMKNLSKEKRTVKQEKLQTIGFID